MSIIPTKLKAFIVTHDRAAQLERCLQSLTRAQEKSAGRIELSTEVLLDGADPESEAVLRRAGVSFLAPSERLNPARGRNLLLQKHAQENYDWALFIDDDAFIEPDYFERFLEALHEEPEAAAIGGPNLTPPGSNGFQIATGEVLSCRLANFLSSARYRSRGKRRRSGEEELILCNLLVRKSWMERVRFPEAYVCAEENRLLQELKTRGAILVHEPSLWVFHERRETPASLSRQVTKYGIGRGQNLRDARENIRAPYVGPSLTLITAFVLAVSAAFGDRASGNALLFATLGYAGVCIAASLWLAVRAKETQKLSRAWLFLLCLEVFPIIHFSYAVGVLRGLTLSRRYEEAL